jgi:predicted tellurium resistance membrane protein TerC
MKKVVGYLISLAGLVFLASSFKNIGSKIPLVQSIPSNILMIGGVVLVILGVVFISSGSRGKAPKEVPIYHGKHIVGYRRG